MSDCYGKGETRREEEKFVEIFLKHTEKFLDFRSSALEYLELEELLRFILFSWRGMRLILRSFRQDSNKAKLKSYPSSNCSKSRNT